MNFTLPRWRELPTIELYLDQVLLFVNEVCGVCGACSGDKGLTASMVNNYVKNRHIAKPVRKKYDREQIARLIIITHLKNVFSIQDICAALEYLRNAANAEEVYNCFVECMNSGDKDDFASRGIPEIVVRCCDTLKLYYQSMQLLREASAI